MQRGYAVFKKDHAITAASYQQRAQPQLLAERLACCLECVFVVQRVLDQILDLVLVRSRRGKVNKSRKLKPRVNDDGVFFRFSSLPNNCAIASSTTP